MQGAAGHTRLVGAIAVVLLTCWGVRLEFFPFTGMQMFSDVRGPIITYEIPIAQLASGELIRAPIEDGIPAMRDARFRRILQRAFEENSGEQVEEFFRTVIDRWNAASPPERRIQHIEIERREWNYETDPDDPEHGAIIASRVFPSVAARTDEPASTDE
jgi:hypothetical protein